MTTITLGQNTNPEKKSGKNWFKKLTKSEALAMAKPWLETGAKMAGVKSLYDVPEYFREKLELRGLKIGSKEFGAGLSGATADLLENSIATTKKRKGGETSRNDLFSKLSELEKSGQTNSEEYKSIQEKLDASESTEVRDAIAKVNKKLALTKEGNVKNSEARKEMARILRENRKAKKLEKDKLKAEVTTVLDDYTNQKVDGITATREALRTTLMVTGAGSLMSAGNLVLDGAGFVQASAQAARRSGEEFNAKALANSFRDKVGDTFSQVKNLAGQGDTSVSRREALGKLMQTANSIATTAGLGSSVISNTSKVLEINRMKKASTLTSQNGVRNVKVEDIRKGQKTQIPTPASKPLENNNQKKDQHISISEHSTYSSKRIKKTDRSDITKTGKKNNVYNVNISNMPGSPKNKTGNMRPTTDENFNQTYKNAGIQAQTIDNEELEQKHYTNQKQIRRSVEVEYLPQYEGELITFVTNKVKNLSKFKSALKQLARYRAVMINRTVLMFMLSTALFQLILGLLSIAFFVAAATLESIMSTATKVTTDDGIFVSGFKHTVNFVGDLASSAITLASQVIGFDISAINPASGFVIMYMLLYAMGMITIFGLLIIYKVNFFRPLDGEKAEEKMAKFFKAYLLYSIPLINFLPFYLSWMWTVTKYPK